MSDDLPSPANQPWFQFAAGDGAPELDLRDHLFFLDLTLDVESQLIAIRSLLHRHRQADETLTAEIQEIEAHAQTVSDHLNERAVDEWLDRLHRSVYQDAAHSMAAVGMLAPLIESIFSQCFQGIGAKFFATTPPVAPHNRWASGHTVQWDCHLVINNGQTRTDLVKGIIQLCEATGLVSRLPVDLQITLSALFAYRNKMFHLGFEWPMAERHAFAARIQSEGWRENWFSKASSGNEPWIFYMSDDFITHTLTTIEAVLDGFATYVKDDLLPHQTSQGLAG